MSSHLKAFAHRVLSAMGVSAVRYHQTYEANRAATLRRRSIDLVIDVGANVGQYAMGLRQNGYAGRILSIEPLPDAFNRLERAMHRDPLWSGLNAAAGVESSRATLNVSADSVCSSLLEPSQTLLDAIPTARVVSTVQVNVLRLRDVLLPDYTKLLLKLDVQGFEREALAGAGSLLDRVDVLELELALQPSYESGYTLESALPELVKLGFSVTSIGRGASDSSTGQLIDLDVLLERAH